MSKMKNMIFLKDIKSNLVEEAIVVFKENVKVKEEQILKSSRVEKAEYQNSNEEVFIKEAEGIINEYVNKIEEKLKEKKLKRNLNFLKVINITLIVAILAILIF